MGSIADNYPVGMSGCDSQGMAGNCGPECYVFQDGECPIEDEIKESTEEQPTGQLKLPFERKES